VTPYTKIDRVVEDITRKIDTGEWPPGHKLPRDEDLRTIYDCSQMTLRTAFERLRPLVVSVAGKGRFVAGSSSPPPTA
jgi:DNA-binding GntR family transcriptional regulator